MRYISTAYNPDGQNRLMYRMLVTSPAEGESVTVSVAAAVTVADGVIVVPIAVETTAVDVRVTVVAGVAVVLADGVVGVDLRVTVVIGVAVDVADGIVGVDVARVEDGGGVGDGSGVRVVVT
jgi:hypothetical protein